MSKLLTVLLLVAHEAEEDGKKIIHEAGKVVDLDYHAACRLIRAGHADDNPVAIAYHKGDLATYQRLLDEAAGIAPKPAAASPDVDQPVAPSAPAADAAAAPAPAPAEPVPAPVAAQQGQ